MDTNDERVPAPEGGAELPDGAAAPGRRRRRRASAMAVGAALAIGLFAGGTVWAAQTDLGSSPAAAAETDQGTTSSRALDRPRGDGFGSSSGGNTTTLPDTTTPDTTPNTTTPNTTTPNTTSTTTTPTTTPATPAQQIGIVTILTTLGYQDAQAAGTGLVLTSDGEILTNNHVIEGATSIEVTVESTGATYTAKVVGSDATADVAVLQLEAASDLKTAAIDQGTVAVGDAVVAVGNAEGGGDLLAVTGTVTALDQPITTQGDGSSSGETLTHLIEIDADVVSGDSGGAVLDAHGEVLGMTTAASSGSADITGYAIPIADAVEVADTILAGTDTETVTIGYPAFLGVQIATDNLRATGAVVGGVIEGTPAATTGLTAGDTITALDDTAVTSADTLSTLLADHAPGDSLTLTWTSASTGESHSATVTLIAGPAD